MGDKSDLVLNSGVKIKPQVDKAEAQRLLKRLYGLSATRVEELTSYDDKNFHIHVESSTSGDVEISENGCVLKILNSLDSKFPDAIDAQNRLIQHIDQQGICTPRPIPNLHNQLWSLERLEKSEDKVIVRLFTFLPGKIFVGVRYSPALLYSIGKLAGKMDSACLEFSDPAFTDYKRIWSLTEVPHLTRFLICLTDPQQRRLVEMVLRDFDDAVVANYSKLKKGVIHGDLSDNNILIRPSSSSPGEFEVAGFIDFGDATQSYYVFEIAILLCYVLIGAGAKDDPVELTGHALAGYLSEFPLSKRDLFVLKLCVTSRLAQSLVLGAYTASVEPENKEYVLQTQTKGWKLLSKLCSMPDSEVFDTWDRILKQYNLCLNQF